MEVAEAWFVDMLTRASVAGALERHARDHPGAARGLLRAA